MNFLAFVNILVILPSIYCLKLDFGSSARVNLEWPFNAKQKFEERTNAPASFNTKDAKQIDVPPLEIHLSKTDKLQLVNTGYSLKIVPSQPNVTSYATGGVMFNNTYIFEKIEFFWSGYNGAPCSHIIDGCGKPLEYEFIFRNIEYPSFEEALIEPDGLVLFTLLGSYQGTVDNRKFGAFEKSASSVHSPNSKPASLSFGSKELEWMDFKRKFSFWYSYPGSYIELDSQTFHYCLTVVVFPDYALTVISEPQFRRTFGGMLSKSNSPLPTTLQSFDMGSRPLVIANGAEFVVQ